MGLIAPGSDVEAVIIRDGRRRTLDVEVGSLEANQQASVSGGLGRDGAADVLGLTIAPADSETMAELGLSGGVMVTRVAPESPAAEAGVARGDVITRLGSHAINSIDDFSDAISQLEPGSSVPARLIRRGSPLFIGIRVPAE